MSSCRVTGGGGGRGSKCGVCLRVVSSRSRGIRCDAECDRWYHAECVGISDSQYMRLSESSSEWLCDKCGLQESNRVLKREVDDANQIVRVLQLDIEELRRLYDDAKKQISNLSEMVIEREQEVVSLKNELESNRLAKIQGISQENVSYGCGARQGMTDFPPLRLSNRFSCLQEEEEQSSRVYGCSSRGAEVNSSTYATSLARGHKYGPNRVVSKPKDCAVQVRSVRPETSTPKRSFDKTTAHSSDRVDLGGKAAICNVPGGTIGGPNAKSSLKYKTHCSLNKRKLLILSDSHGRHLAGYLNIAVQDRFQVLAICRPNAKLAYVLDDVISLTKDYGRDDVVVLIGGSNDITQRTHTVISNNVKQKLRSLADIQVIMCSLPKRHDRPYLNDTIYRVNKDLSSNEATKHFNLLSFDFKRELFTAHGQHLNKRGKLILSKKIINCIDKTKTSQQSFLES